MKCPKCKKQLRKNAKFCPACGAKVEKKRGVRVVSVLLVITLLLGVVATGIGGGTLFAKYLGDDHTDIFPKFANRGNTDSVITTEQIEAAQITYNTIIAEADKLTEKYCNSNNEVTIDDLPKLLKEVAQYANELKNTGVISSFSYSDGDTCVYMQIDDWLNILYDPIVDGYMAGGLDRGFQIITLEPNASAIEMYFNYVTTGAEGADQAAQMVENSFDNFYFSTNLDDKHVTIDAFVNLPQDSIIIFSGHGGYASEVGGVLFTGVNAWDKDLISKYCEVGSRAVCFNKKGQAYLTSEFFDRYVKDEQYNGNLFYLGSCSSCHDARLIQSIWDKGARAIVGNSNSVYIRYNFRMIASFFEGLTSKDESGKYRTISEALEYAQNIHGITDGNICQVIACFRDDFRLSEMGSIPDTDHFTDTSFSLSVLDAEMKAYGDYSLFISGSTSVTGPLLNKNDSQYQRSEVISSTAPVKIDLLPGTYTLTITDNANPTNAEKVTISVFDDAQLSHNIELKTTFGQENTVDARGSLAANEYILLDSDDGSVFLAADDSSINQQPSDEANLSQVPYQIVRDDFSIYENGEMKIELFYDCVVLQGNSAEYRKINALIKEAEQGYMGDFPNSSTKDYPFFSMEDTGYLFHYAEGSVSYQAQGILSIRMRENHFMGGTVTCDTRGLNFNLYDGTSLDLFNLLSIKYPDRIDSIRNQVWDYLQNHHSQGLYEDAKNYILKTSLKDFNYYITSEGEIVIVFPKYTIGVGAAGCIEVPTTLFLKDTSPSLYDSSLPYNSNASSNNGKNLFDTDRATLISMDSSMQYRVNIFLSNFSEQYFNESSLQRFDANNPDYKQVIDFVYKYNYLNHPDRISSSNERGENEFCITVDEINRALNRFFNFTLTEDAIRNTHKDYYSGKVFYPFAMGDSYPNFTVAEHLYDLGDGTYGVDFVIYSADLAYVKAGGCISDSSLYKLSISEARNADGGKIVKQKTGTAVIRPYQAETTSTYQLCAYVVNG